MTEKRFTLIKDTGTDECYSDNLYDNGTYIGAICGGSEMICYLLNTFHKEKEQVKKVLQKYLEHYIERTIILKEPYGDVTKAIHDIADELGVELE